MSVPERGGLLVKNRITATVVHSKIEKLALDDGRQKDMSARNAAIIISIRHVPKRRRRWMACRLLLLSKPPKTAWRGVVCCLVCCLRVWVAATLRAPRAWKAWKPKPRRLEAATTRRDDAVARWRRGTGAGTDLEGAWVHTVSKFNLRDRVQRRRTGRDLHRAR